jgi:hypothetical protein
MQRRCMCFRLCCLEGGVPVVVSSLDERFLSFSLHELGGQFLGHILWLGEPRCG